MVNERYARSYTEVLEILKYLPEEEFNKIPKKKIDFFEKNKDKFYQFSIDPKLELEKQNISIEANSIMVELFRDYFANELQRQKLNILLEQNEQRYQEELNKKYNTENLFKESEEKNYKDSTYNQEEKSIVNYKESIFNKIVNKIKSIFRTS